MVGLKEAGERKSYTPEKEKKRGKEGGSGEGKGSVLIGSNSQLCSDATF